MEVFAGHALNGVITCLSAHGVHPYLSLEGLLSLFGSKSPKPDLNPSTELLTNQGIIKVMNVQYLCINLTTLRSYNYKQIKQITPTYCFNHVCAEVPNIKGSHT